MLELTRRVAILATGACIALSAVTARAEAPLNPYLKADAVPLMSLLIPPPAKDSAQTKAELAEVLSLQASRTEAQAKHGAADAEESVFRFLAGMGITLEKDKVPLATAVFQRIADTEEVVTDVAKKGFGRPRPHMVEPAIKPIVKPSTSGAYPSGHTTYGTVVGLVLAEMMPEKRAEIGARILDYANSRLVVGIHYRSDLLPGHIGGTLIAHALFKDEAFMKDFAVAKVELRKALGM